MKKTLIIITVIVFTTASIVQGSDFAFLQTNSFCALGQITELHEDKPGHWSIEITNVRILLQNWQSHETLNSKDFVKNYTNLTVNLISGFGGILLWPERNWIGRTVLFSATEHNGSFTVPGVQLPLSPTGQSFSFVEEPMIGSIEEVVDILKLNDRTMKLKRMIEFVESPAEPIFLRAFSIQQVAKLGIEKFKLDPDIHTQIKRWRDSKKFIPELRIAADNTLINNSPRTYQWGEERLEFLRELKDEPEISNQMKHKITHSLNEAQRLKSAHVSDE